MSSAESTRDLPIEFKEAGIRIGDVVVLDRITLQIRAGEPTVLIGPNGSGKTTLLRAAMGLIPVSQGSITWAGRAAAAPSQRAIVFQRPAMLRRSVSGNLHYALGAAGVPRREWAARSAVLLSLVGLDGLDERPARRLSGGEQQRLSLARAMARDPAVLFLDEPTASLDPASTQMIEDFVRTVSARGVKVVMATHDLAEARRLGGEILLLHRGNVVESGPAAAFFAAPRTDAARRFVSGELLI
jgi:tungstate transport system ATP-binding protein